MITNYFKIVWRNLKKSKVNSFINVFGLALGLACGILILAWVQDELSFDRFHQNADNLFRIFTQNQVSNHSSVEMTTPFALAPAVKTNIPEVKGATRFFNTGWAIQFEEKIFSKEGAFVDPDFLTLFDVSFTLGNPATALSDPYSIILTDAFAHICFGDDNPIGKTVKIDNAVQVTVTGVVKEWPRQSSLMFDYLIPMDILRVCGFDGLNSWQASPFNETYVLLHAHADRAAIETKMTHLIHENQENSTIEAGLQNYTRIHLHLPEGGGPISYLIIMSMVAIFILFIACINFMNLSIARAGTRAGEIAMRKVIGANRLDLVQQFLNETILLTLMALVISFFLVEASLPTFNRLSGKMLDMNLMGNPQLLTGICLLTLVTGFLAGGYPAFVLSSIRPVQLFGNHFKLSVKGPFFRRALTVLQFSLSILLIICTMVAYHQLTFIRNKPLGYNQAHLFCARMASGNRDYESIRHEFLKHPGILSVTSTDRPPTYRGEFVTDVDWQGKDPADNTKVQIRAVNHGYFETMGMDIIAGRAFLPKYTSDQTNGLIVNETAARVMGFTSPVGQHVIVDSQDYIIQGVVKDFHLSSLHQKIEPLFIMLKPERCLYLCMRISSRDLNKTLAFLESKWDKVDPGYPFEFTFLDDRIDRLYRADKQLGEMSKIFTFITILIACLGLFGLSSLTIVQRTKEIGIRKVLGSSAFKIIYLLSKEYIRMVILANLIAWPVAWYAMNKWLQNFAYRIDLTIWPFLLSGLLALLIAILTVSWQAVRAAITNPVESLRYE